MQCDVCITRSSVGFCVECKKLLCEECSVPCQDCGKLSCPDHVHVTKRSFKQVCVKCAEKRGEVSAPVEAEPVDEDIDESLGFQLVAPWRLSWLNTCLAWGFTLCMLLFTNLRVVPLPGGGVFKTAWVVLLLPPMGVGWGLREMLRDHPRKRPLQGIASVAWSLFAFILLIGILRRS